MIKPRTTRLVAIRKKWNRERAKKYLAHSLISPKVVRGFLDAPRESHVWMKKLPRSTIKNLVTDEWKDFHTEPYLHQWVCMALGISYPQFLFLLDMGLGKTFVILNLLRYHKARTGLKQTLVLAPSAVNLDTWVKQITKHAPQLTYQLLVGSATEREALVETSADLCLMNYAGLSVYMTKFAKKTKGKGEHRVFVQSKVNKFASRFNGLVLDESHKLGAQDALVSRLVGRVAENCHVRYGATGTPFGRNPLRLWSQFKLIDDGETLGETMPMFRQAFYTGKVNYFGGTEWTFDERLEPRLHQIIQHRSIRYEDEECNDLPKMVEETISVPLSAEQKVYYNRALAKLKETRGDYRSLQNPFMRLRQITAGFLGLKTEDDERTEEIFTENAKLAALLDLLESVPVGSKVVVFHEFHPSGELIEEVFKLLGVQYAAMRGGKKNVVEYNRFLKDPACTALVANSVSGGTGVDELQYVSRFVVFYELPVNPADYWQAVKRVYRTGQSNRVYKYILEAKGTVDEKVYGFIKEGRNLFEAVCNGKAKETLREV